MWSYVIIFNEWNEWNAKLMIWWKQIISGNFNMPLCCIPLWTSCQIRNIASYACTGNTGNVSSPPRVSHPGMHHGKCVTHVSWCMPWWLNSGYLWSRWEENDLGIPGTCATRNVTYLVRGPYYDMAYNTALTEAEHVSEQICLKITFIYRQNIGNHNSLQDRAVNFVDGFFSGILVRLIPFICMGLIVPNKHWLRQWNRDK